MKIVTTGEMGRPVHGRVSRHDWASAYSVQADEYVFSGLVDASPDEQGELDVMARAPFGDPQRVEVVVARLPLALVEGVWTAD